MIGRYSKDVYVFSRSQFLEDSVMSDWPHFLSPSDFLLLVITSFGRAVCPSLYTRQADVLCLRCYSVPSASRHISAVTRDFQTAPQIVLVLSVLFGHSYLIHIAYYYLFILVDLAITDII